jgi:Ca-activated chloride channel family protein
LPVDVLPVNAAIQVPATARAGDRFDVTWTGPANASDYLAIGTIGGSGSDYENYAYVQQGSPLQVVAPAQAGNYEVRYVQRQSRTVLARQAIRITD